MRININVYLHSNKSSNYEKGKEVGLTGDALDRFMYTGYEEKITYSVDVETGDSRLIAVNDIPLRTKE